MYNSATFDESPHIEVVQDVGAPDEHSLRDGRAAPDSEREAGDGAAGAAASPEPEPMPWGSLGVIAANPARLGEVPIIKAFDPRIPTAPEMPHLVHRTAASEALGWSAADAEWLALVCVYSGVFTRRQYRAQYHRDKNAPQGSPQGRERRCLHRHRGPTGRRRQERRPVLAEGRRSRGPPSPTFRF